MNTDTTNALTPSAKSSPRNALYSPAPADTRTRGGRGGRPRSDAINLFTPSRGARYALTTADVQLTAVTLETDRGHVDDRIRLPVTDVNSVTRKHGRGSGSLRASDQRIRLVINRSPSAGHHHRRRRRRRRTDTRQPMFAAGTGVPLLQFSTSEPFASSRHYRYRVCAPYSNIREGRASSIADRSRHA